jgi:DNA-directed RNA polymerase specialized sigma24 family protein
LPYEQAVGHFLRVRGEEEPVLPDELNVNDSFSGFVRGIEPRLREVLSATLGSDVGREATAEALAYAWEHWPKVREMENPSGYLYVLGRDRGRRRLRHSRRLPQRVTLMPVDGDRTPWVEPQLPAALSSLPEQQRVVVMLLHCFEWTMSEVAEVLGVSKSTVQSHAERGMARLRRRMGVTL